MIKSVVIDFRIGESIGVTSEASFIAADGFRILTDKADVIALPFNRLSITFKVESVKSLTFNYK